VAGIDLSQTTDLTAAVIVVEKNGRLNVFAHFWMPSERIDQRVAEDGVPYYDYMRRGFLSPSGENIVDYSDVFNWMTQLISEHEIYPLKVGYDRYSSQYLVKDLEGAGFQCDDVYQGDNLWPVLQEMEGLIKDGRIYIGDNDLLKSHLLNAAVKMSIERGRGRLVKINQRARIDGVAALADAICVRQKWYSEIGYQLTNEE
jgi:phage terminase large subunit-like protein